jgi:predicted aspartyl protease
MRLLCLLLAATFVAAPLTARAGDTSASLLGKHRAYTGWKFGDPGISNEEITETVAGADLKPVSVRHIRRIGAIFRTDIHDVKANIDYSQGFTGNIFWYADQNGFVVPIIGDPARVKLAQDFFFSDGIAELPWRITGTEHKWDKTYTVVRITHNTAATIDLYVDPQTGAYGGATFDPGGDNEVTYRVLAYADAAPGRKVISRWQIDGSKNTISDDPIKSGVTITNDDLHPPHATASWTFANTDPFPIELTKTRVIVKAKINGVEGRFLLDSGADDIFISGAFARRAGLKPIGHSEASTLYGTEKTDVGRASTLELGGNTLHDLTLYFGQESIDEDAPDGLLGFALLAGAFITVDFEHSKMQIQDPASVDNTSLPGVHVAVDLSSGQPVTPMGVQQKTAVVNALLDTGSPEVILIDEALPGKYGLHMTTAGVLGGCGLLDNMTLGPIVYDQPNACTVPDFGIHNALLGYDFLKGLGKLQFDYSHAGLILVPRSKN